MQANKIREKFLEFFRSKDHKIVKSAPMVLKDDPTLMFTNAGMNQFKDIFLENRTAPYPRVADSQKCLRVSGKHNDLEEVGHDTYHHTMFEMLGNWSFGDYFKEKAIDYAWELFTQVFNLSKDRLYATVFEGNPDENISKDTEAENYWKKYLPPERILTGNKDENFWEMGDTGPCGPASEIHIDLRPDNERNHTPGAELVNQDHPFVIELWNLVFIQYNRKTDGTLEPLPKKHVDTGLGFERLTMVLQNKSSNYDTDIFQPIIAEIEKVSGENYGENNNTDVAMRVIADHLRTISFSIAEGQLPSNNKAGYVIRRILRRAVRYAFTFLNQTEAFIFKLVPTLVENMGGAYPELVSQKDTIQNVIKEEEETFLKTLDTGIKMLDKIIGRAKTEGTTTIDGRKAFELYDTYGFPSDLTQLILREHNLSYNQEEFDKAMAEQKARSRNASVVEAGDWIIVKNEAHSHFIGYEHTEAEVNIVKYREVKQKKKTYYQLVFDKTPFYAESGGQIGDTGSLENNEEKISIANTIKEHDSTIHITSKLPRDITTPFYAVVNESERRDTEKNHTATHLLHYALKKVLGNHVEQKGSLVAPEYLRFDFSHYQKLTSEDIQKVENIVNDKIRRNIRQTEERNVEFNEALKKGANALFGEKYGDTVRMVQFGDSIELCGGTHVSATGNIGFFVITSETAISSGIRRIEAVTGTYAESVVQNKMQQLEKITQILDNPKDIVKKAEKLRDENNELRKQVEKLEKEKNQQQKQKLLESQKQINGINVITGKLEVSSADALKEISFKLKNEVNNLFLVLGAEIDGKANLSVTISDNLVKEKNLDANKIIKDLAGELQGGGGGQAFFATAGGKNPDGIDTAIKKAISYI